VTTHDIVLVERPDPGLRETILRPLVDYNASIAGATTVEPLAIVLRDPESDAIIGGLWAISAYDWLYIELLFVPEELRAQGIGSQLMKKAEEIAAQRGHIGVRLDSFSFQAPRFYEKLGYREYGRLANIPEGHERIYYFKTLPENAAKGEAR
jgi:GNAT superfamily N-acetyltransferase